MIITGGFTLGYNHNNNAANKQKDKTKPKK